MQRMPKNETIENRVYLFESLARGLIEMKADDLTSRKMARRARALRALADLAYVSCAVADTGDKTPIDVRQTVLAAVGLEPPDVEPEEEDDADVEA